MYGKGFTTNQISETVQDIYGFDVSDGFISLMDYRIRLRSKNGRTGRSVPVILSFISMSSTSVRGSTTACAKKMAGYVVPGNNSEGMKEILTIEVGENQNSRYGLES